MALANACRWDRITGFIYRRMSSDDKGRNALLGLTANLPDASQREKTLAMLVDSARNTGRHEMPADWPQYPRSCAPTPRRRWLRRWTRCPRSLAMRRRSGNSGRAL